MNQKLIFGETILKKQRNPVTITHNGKPVTVMISFKEYQGIEELKQLYLQQIIQYSTKVSHTMILQPYKNR